MELEIYAHQPAHGIVGSLEPSHLWALGLAASEDPPPVGRRIPSYSYLADCECPDDCLRDHEND